jgi:hypothetical protein
MTTIKIKAGIKDYEWGIDEARAIWRELSQVFGKEKDYYVPPLTQPTPYPQPHWPRDGVPHTSPVLPSWAGDPIVCNGGTRSPVVATTGQHQQI